MKYNGTYIFISLFLELNMSAVTFGFQEWLINMCAGCSHLPALESQSQGKADKTYFHSFCRSLQSRKPCTTAKNFFSFFCTCLVLTRGSFLSVAFVKCHLFCAKAGSAYNTIRFVSGHRAGEQQNGLWSQWCFTSRLQNWAEMGLLPVLCGVVAAGTFGFDWFDAVLGSTRINHAVVKALRKAYFCLQQSWPPSLLCQSKVCVGQCFL